MFKHLYLSLLCLLCCVVLEAEKLFIDAAKRNDVETMKTLGRGLNANAKNVVSLFLHLSEHVSILSPRSKNRSLMILKLFGGGGGSQHNRTALHYAVAGKNKEAVKLLLQRRVKVDQKDKVGWFETPAPKTLRRTQQLM